MAADSRGKSAAFRVGIMLSIETESFGVVVADGDIMLIGVVACRAYFRRFCAGIFVAADEALPCNGF